MRRNEVLHRLVAGALAGATVQGFGLWALAGNVLSILAPAVGKGLSWELGKVAKARSRRVVAQEKTD